jgi:hypothetical protein
LRAGFSTRISSEIDTRDQFIDAASQSVPQRRFALAPKRNESFSFRSGTSQSSKDLQQVKVTLEHPLGGPRALDPAGPPISKSLPAFLGMRSAHLATDCQRITCALDGEPQMTDCRTFHGVTQAIFACVKQKSLAEHGTVYDPATGNKGTATTKVPVVGTIVVSFDFDPNPNVESITYCIISKPWIVSASQIFDGIGDTIDSCRQK